MKSLLIFMGITLICISCNVQPEPIAYGHDACHFCKMTIIDQTHAAQLVTKKGKQFKYDAIECMVNNIQENYAPEQLSTILVANYSNAGEMIDAKTAHYIISSEISSPMGANLSAIPTQTKAEELQKAYKGTLYTWDTLLALFNEKNNSQQR